MLTEYVSSKEVIKSRMIRHALNYWGFKNAEDLDPLVKLIMEALSLELYNLGNEVKDAQVRILEKIAGLLTPDFLTAPNPAHAIMYATPVEPNELLTHATSFIAQKKVSSRQQENGEANLEIYFTPVDAIQLVDAQVTLLATGNNLYTYEGTNKKRLQARFARGRHMESQSVWLALHINEMADAERLSFYFDWNSVEPKLAHRIYQLLPLTKWYLNDQELTTAPGLYYSAEQIEASGSEQSFLDYDLLSLVEQDIKQYYHPMFITLDGQDLMAKGNLKQKYPPVFSNYFAESDLQQLTNQLVWIKIEFPVAMQQDMLNEVDVYLNAFPVMNRKVNDLKYRLKGGSNIIPLKTNVQDQFLAIKSLTDDTYQYKPVPYRKTDQEPVGTYTLRHGGVERFDNRNAREWISYLLELLRSESAAFAAYGYDFIATTLKELNQKMALMEQKTKGYIDDASEVPNYIIVKPFEGKDMMYAEYWTTMAEAANGLRTGTRLQQAKGVKVKQESIVLLTTTMGGKNKLRPEERLNAFRYGIMTRNRIITKEDIRNFCFYELGNRIERVTIEKGFELSPNPKEAFKRTIDVILTPLETETLDNKEWQVLCEQLHSKLQTRSGMSNNYRVLIHNG